MEKAQDVADSAEAVGTKLNALRTMLAHRMEHPAASTRDHMINMTIADHLRRAAKAAEVYTKTETFGEDPMSLDEDGLNIAYHDLLRFAGIGDVLETLMSIMDAPVNMEGSSLSPLFRRMAAQDYKSVAGIVDEVNDIWQELRGAINRRRDALAVEAKQRSGYSPRLQLVAGTKLSMHIS